jgi:hypothetical protein
MLWSVVVTDLLFKLDHLANAYGDPTATSILTEIGEARRNNPKSPEWETELVTKIASRTDLLDHAELSFLQSLQAHRHLSAHPVLTGSDALFSPNKETARAHIRNALEAVLTKPAIMSRKVFDRFAEDIEQLSHVSPGRDGLNRFLSAKYFRHFSPTTFAQVFKSLWRVTFKSRDERCEKNRMLNADALSVVFDQRRVELTELVKNERDWFSDVTFIGTPIPAMANFFREHPSLFPLLTDALKAPFQKLAELNLDNFASCWFISANPVDHITAVIERVNKGETITSEAFPGIVDSLRTTDAYEAALSIGALLYSESGSFDTADERFADLIKPYLTVYTKKNMQAFLAGCETCYNRQATGRSRARRDHLLVKAVLDSRFSDIDLAAYPVFMKSLQE